MNTKSDHETAKILLFPVRGRAASGSSQRPVGTVVKLPTSQLQYVDYGSGWYHDAAIAEAGQNKR